MNRIVRVLNDVIRKERTTVYGVAKAIGVDVSSLYRALKNGGNLGAKSIDKILEHLGYEVKLIKSKEKEVKPTRSQSHKRRR
jgi:DNA-binding phage protein